MKKVALLLLLAVSLFAFNSCTKTGPQGPQGPAGYDGNANVVGSEAFTPNWGSYNLTDRWYSVTYDHPEITTSVVDRGIVEIFKSYGTNTWTNLPDINGLTTTVFDFFDGGFRLYVMNTDGSQPSSPQGTVYRVVVVSPSFRLAHPNTNTKDYNELMAAMNADKAAAANQ